MLQIRKITEADPDLLETMTDWMYVWWGKEEGNSRKAVYSAMANSLCKEGLPQTYGLFLEGRLIGMYQFVPADLFVRPDLYPWLANVWLEEEFRGRGYGRLLMESVKENAKKYLKAKYLYLFTKHRGFYEKFGWTVLEEVDTCREELGIRTIYRLVL